KRRGGPWPEPGDQTTQVGAGNPRWQRQPLPFASPGRSFGLILRGGCCQRLIQWDADCAPVGPHREGGPGGGETGGVGGAMQPNPVRAGDPGGDDRPVGARVLAAGKAEPGQAAFGGEPPNVDDGGV